MPEKNPTRAAAEAARRLEKLRQIGEPPPQAPPPAPEPEPTLAPVEPPPPVTEA